MTSAPRLVLLDLDRTLLGSDGRVSERNSAALHRAAAAGAHVVIATARPVRWLAPFRRSIPSTVAICSNGGLVVDLGAGTVLRTHLLDGSRLLELAVRLRAEGASVAFAVEGLPELGMLAEDHYVSSVTEEIERRVLAELFTVPIVKGLLRGPPEAIPPIRALLEREYGDVLTATHSGEAGQLEISSRGRARARALVLTRRRLR